MPGALPVRRMRRDAARPSVARGNAVNSIVAMLATPSRCLRPSGSMPVVRDGHVSARSARREKLWIITKPVPSAAMPPCLGPAVARMQRVGFADVLGIRQAVDRLADCAVGDGDARLVVHVRP